MIKYLISSVNITLLVACNGNNVQNETTETFTDTLVELTVAQLKNAGIETGRLQQRSISS